MLTHLSAYSAAATRVKPSTACFDAVYAAMYGEPMREVMDATLITRPQRRWAMGGMKARVHRNGPVAFTAMIRFHSSRLVDLMGAELAVPALLTRMST